MALGLLVCCLAALLPAIMLYFPNMKEITFWNMAPYFGVLVLLAGLAWAGMYLITRRKELSSVAAVLWLLVLLNVGRIVPVLHTVWPLAGIKVIAPVTFLVLVGITYGLSRLKESFLHDVAVVIAFALAAFILSSAVPSLIPDSNHHDEEAVQTLSGSCSDIYISPAQQSDKPNFWWIVSDEYAGFEELQKYYHYDNSEFYHSLESMGFSVSKTSHNWTSDTYRIFRDILNLRYVNDSEGDKNELVADPDAPLWTLFRSLGYDVFEVESGNKFRLTDRLAIAERINMPETTDGETVANLLLRYSILYRYEEEIMEMILPRQTKKSARESILNVFHWADNPQNLISGKPAATIIYVKCPHSPYLFDREGNEVPAEYQKEDLKNKKPYLDQLIYTTTLLEKLCRTIISADPDSIIILQSDHGQRSVANVTYLDQCNILNAVYFRGKPFHESVGKNGLNTWLAVLRKQFCLNLPDVHEVLPRNEYRPNRYDPDEEDPNKGLIDQPE